MLNLEGLDEYRSFSIREPFDRDYTPVWGGEVKTFPIEGMYNIDIINGEVQVESTDLYTVKQVNYHLEERDNPITRYAEPFHHFSYKIEFKKQPDRPVVLKNFLNSYKNRVISTIEIVVSDHITLDILELNISDAELLSVSNRVFTVNHGRIYYSRKDFTDLETSLFFNYFGEISYGDFRAVNLSSCGNYSMDNWDMVIKTKESRCEIFGVTELSKEMRHGTICKIHHSVGGSYSAQEFRHILRDNSYGMYDGDSIISTGASDSVSSQVSKTILISPNARILNKPRLNIYNSDVKATHGATVGKLDPESVFYLKQRGYNQELVEKLLLDGFIKDVLDRVTHKSIKEFLYDKR